LFRSDHYMNLDGLDPRRAALDAWGTICGLAALTSTLRLGTMVSPATFRHPSNLAKLVATADHISQGRVDLGLGAGWHEREHAAYGFPFADTRTRMDVLEEQLQIVLGHWGSESFSHHGRHYDLTELEACPKPLQRPHPPLIMGGNAGPRSATLAAAHADEYNTPFPTLQEVRKRKGRIDEACQRAGRDPIPFSIMTAVLVGADEGELRLRVSQRAAKMGTDATALFHDPPPGWIVGTLDQAAEQLSALGDAGVSRVLCQHYVHQDLDAVALLGEQLAARVA
jgi:alkanesulfonate monooxygenase SsuD/methylene tetrahydromethanopterin reductase-like flavin-dependent oxidoreductase (luciferase family)